MAYIKTAKDKAWDKERLRLMKEAENWRKMVIERDKQLSEKDKEIKALTCRIADLEAAIGKLTEGNATPDEIIKKINKNAELADSLKFLVNGVRGMW